MYYDIRFCSWNVDISRSDSGFCYYPSLLYLLCPRLEMSDGSIKRTFGEIWRECLTQFSFTALNLLTYSVSYTDILRKKQMSDKIVLQLAIFWHSEKRWCPTYFSFAFAMNNLLTFRLRGNEWKCDIIFIFSWLIQRRMASMSNTSSIYSSLKVGEILSEFRLWDNFHLLSNHSEK